MYHTEFRVFWEVDFADYSQRRLEEMKHRISAESENYILNVNETEYLEHIISQASVEPLVIHFDRIEASSREEMVAAEYFPPMFNVFHGKSYSRPVITYHVPVTGDLELLRCTPNPRVMMTHTVRLEPGGISFEFIDFYGEAERIRRESENILDTLKRQSESLASNVAHFNASLRNQAENLFTARKNELLRRSTTLAGLGVPIRKATNVPATFSVPARRKQITTKPTASSIPPKAPDPTMDEAIYREILQTIHETGKVFERLPRTYADKDEEALRDHLILQLEPRFAYSTTGETFNKQGKTDILIRHEKSNLFVAECKFWSGAKNHFETLDQILSYLTWRDSKTAIVYFMDTKEMAAPLRAIEESSPQHTCFLKLNEKKESSWFDYTFHLPSDANIAVRVSILCFHLPKQTAK
jgi:hypothetical protein